MTATVKMTESEVIAYFGNLREMKRILEEQEGLRTRLESLPGAQSVPVKGRDEAMYTRGSHGLSNIPHDWAIKSSEWETRIRRLSAEYDARRLIFMVTAKKIAALDWRSRAAIWQVYGLGRSIRQAALKMHMSKDSVRRILAGCIENMEKNDDCATGAGQSVL